jgi:hypothetical protein
VGDSGLWVADVLALDPMIYIRVSMTDVSCMSNRHIA